MKTSSRIILENIKIDKELRINAELVDDKNIKSKLYSINTLIDNLNNETQKESDRLFLLENIIKELLEFSKNIMHKLMSKDDDFRVSNYKVQKLKSFLQSKNEVDREYDDSDDSDDVDAYKIANIKRRLNLWEEKTT